MAAIAWAQAHANRAKEDDFIALAGILSPSHYTLARLLYHDLRDECLRQGRRDLPVAEARRLLGGDKRRATIIIDGMAAVGIWTRDERDMIADPRLWDDCQPLRKAATKARVRRAAARQPSGDVPRSLTETFGKVSHGQNPQTEQIQQVEATAPCGRRGYQELEKEEEQDLSPDSTAQQRSVDRSAGEAMAPCVVSARPAQMQCVVSFPLQDGLRQMSDNVLYVDRNAAESLTNSQTALVPNALGTLPEPAYRQPEEILQALAGMAVKGADPQRTDGKAAASVRDAGVVTHAELRDAVADARDWVPDPTVAQVACKLKFLRADRAAAEAHRCQGLGARCKSPYRQTSRRTEGALGVMCEEGMALGTYLDFDAIYRP